jgi:hypothetical protein
MYLQVYSRPAPEYNFLSTLVDLGLGQVVDLLGTVLDLSVGSLETAKNAGALGNVVVASQLVVGNAVQSTAAYSRVCQHCFSI